MAEHDVGVEVEEEELSEAEFAQLGPVDQAREILGAGPDLDPLDVLLAEDKSSLLDTYVATRVLSDGSKRRIEFLVRPIPDDAEYDRIIQRCTTHLKRQRGGSSRDLDVRRLARLVVAGYTVNPVFDLQAVEASNTELSDEVRAQGRASHARLVAKFSEDDPESLVREVLLPGEIDGMSDKILTLSGFTDEVVDAAGN